MDSARPPGVWLPIGSDPGLLAVDWDREIGPRHAKIRLADDVLEVRRHSSASSPPIVEGEGRDTFELRAGGSFRIGRTTFTLGHRRADG